MENNKIGLVYKSLAMARVRLQEENLKKSGENKYSNFTYFELKDFLPAINKINAELNLFSMFNFPNESVDKKARLTIMSTEDGSEIVFESEVAECIMKTKEGRVNPIQEQGAKHTYIRRYLYMEAYEIAENDLVDSMDLQPINTQKQSPRRETPKPITQDQLSKIYAMANKENISKKDLEGTLSKTYKKNIKDLTVAEGVGLINSLPEIFGEIKERIKKAIATIMELVNDNHIDDSLSNIMEQKKIVSLNTCALHTLMDIYKALQEEVKSFEQPKEPTKEPVTVENTQSEQPQKPAEKEAQKTKKIKEEK